VTKFLKLSAALRCDRLQQCSPHHAVDLSTTAGTTRPALATRRGHFDDNQAYAQPPLQQSHQSSALYATTPTQPAVGTAYATWRGLVRGRTSKRILPTRSPTASRSVRSVAVVTSTTPTVGDMPELRTCPRGRHVFGVWTNLPSLWQVKPLRSLLPLNDGRTSQRRIAIVASTPQSSSSSNDAKSKCVSYNSDVNNFVELRIRRKHTRALVDTGAYYNCLNLSFANRMKLRYFPTSPDKPETQIESA